MNALRESHDLPLSGACQAGGEGVGNPYFVRP